MREGKNKMFKFKTKKAQLNSMSTYMKILDGAINEINKSIDKCKFHSMISVDNEILDEISHNITYLQHSASNLVEIDIFPVSVKLAIMTNITSLTDSTLEILKLKDNMFSNDVLRDLVSNDDGNPFTESDLDNDEDDPLNVHQKMAKMLQNYMGKELMIQENMQLSCKKLHSIISFEQKRFDAGYDYALHRKLNDELFTGDRKKIFAVTYTAETDKTLGT